jgi:hypothetical protein
VNYLKALIRSRHIYHKNGNSKAEPRRTLRFKISALIYIMAIEILQYKRKLILIRKYDRRKSDFQKVQINTKKHYYQALNIQFKEQLMGTP